MRHALLAVVVLLVAAGVAHGAGHKNFPASLQTEVPPGGTSTITSPGLLGAMKSLKVDVEPAFKDDTGPFAGLQAFLSAFPSPKSKLLACVFVYVASVSDYTDAQGDPVTFKEEDRPLAALLFAACLELRQAMVAAGHRRAATAATGCGQAPLQVPATFTRNGSKYSLGVDGAIAKATKRAQRLKVTCKRRGAGYRLTLRSRKRGQRLRKLIGPKLQLGLFNPPDATGPATAKLTFRR